MSDSRIQQIRAKVEQMERDVAKAKEDSSEASDYFKSERARGLLAGIRELLAEAFVDVIPLMAGLDQLQAGMKRLAAAAPNESVRAEWEQKSCQCDELAGLIKRYLACSRE